MIDGIKSIKKIDLNSPLISGTTQQVSSTNAVNNIFDKPAEERFNDPLTGKNINKTEATEINADRTARRKEKIEQNNHAIVLHEEAHNRESGEQASGGPVVNYGASDEDGTSIATDGHQMINMPPEARQGQPLNIIDKTIKSAKAVIKGALAPLSAGVPAPQNQLSEADKNVASRGQAILSNAENLKQQRTEKEQKGEIKPEENAENSGESNSEAKNKDKKIKQGTRIDLAA